MAPRISVWEYTQWKDGRTTQDRPYVGLLSSPEPRDEWLSERSSRVAGFHGGLFFAVAFAVAVMLAPWGVFALAAGAAAGAATVIASKRTGLWRRADIVGNGRLFLTSPPNRTETDARIQEILNGLRFEKVRHDHQWMEASMPTNTAFPERTTYSPTYACDWYAGSAVFLRVQGVGGIGARMRPPVDPSTPCAFELRTRGRENVMLHRRLKGELSAAFAGAGQSGEPWIPPPEQRPEPLEP